MKKSLLMPLVILSLCASAGCVNEEFGGVGIEVPTRSMPVSKTNPYIIVEVFSGGAGESAGLKRGDTIVTIDGRTLDGLNEDYIVKNLLRGKVGSSVTLEIERGNGSERKLMLFKIPRGRIVLQE